MSAQIEQGIPVSLLTAVASKVFETMFFADTKTINVDQRDPALLWTGVAFSGADTGEFFIGVSEEVARAFAADFLGEDNEELENRSMDSVLCELANVVCGATLSAWRPDSLFEILSPSRIEVPEPNMEMVSYLIQGSLVQIGANIRAAYVPAAS